MIMKILELLKDTVQYQILNKRFYNGICPHWFRQIERFGLEVRLTEEIGVINDCMTDFEYPTDDYIKGLTNAERRSLHMTGASVSTGSIARWNILLSTGYQFKIADW